MGMSNPYSTFDYIQFYSQSRQHGEKGVTGGKAGHVGEIKREERGGTNGLHKGREGGKTQDALRVDKRKSRG